MTNLAMQYQNYICRIASTCQLSCNVDITPHRINIKSHNFAMFSPATAAAILNRRNQNRGQEQSSSVTSTRRTSPRLQPAARGGASSQGLLSGGTTESRRGGGTDTTTAPTPSCQLPFGSVHWETPFGLAGNVADMSRHVGDDTTCRSNFGHMGPCRRHKI
jgi:hypothetical protein